MAALPTTTASTTPKCSLIDLPREIRDEIYTYLLDSSPRTKGPLEGYAEIPAPNLLRICTKLREEMTPIFNQNLEKALRHNRVCLRLSYDCSTASTDGRRRPSYAGWSTWTDMFPTGLHRAFHVWYNDSARSDADFAAFWVGARSLNRFHDVRASDSLVRGGGPALQGFLQLYRALEMVQAIVVKVGMANAVRMRLRIVLGRVAKGIEDAKKSNGIKLRPGGGKWRVPWVT